MEHPALKYSRAGTFPSVWCQGCGIGQVWSYTAQAIEELQLNVNDTLWVTGSGCSGRMNIYWKGDALYTLHGRAIAFATGAKLGNPRLNVIVHVGDGEASAIGGNHLIHAARRNVGLCVICINNLNYGMTGGQASPTTPLEANAATTPAGSPFDLCKLVIAAGGTYVARWTTAHPGRCADAIKKGIRHKGFAFIEVVSQCPTLYGRRNKFADPYESMKWLQSNSVYKDDLSKFKPEELRGKFIIGEFLKEDRPEFSTTFKLNQQTV